MLKPPNKLRSTNEFIDAAVGSYCGPGEWEDAVNARGGLSEADSDAVRQLCRQHGEDFDTVVAEIADHCRNWTRRPA